MDDYNALIYRRAGQYERLCRILNLARLAEGDLTKLEIFKASFRTVDVCFQLCEKLSAEIIQLLAVKEPTEAVLKQELSREKDEVKKIDNVYWEILNMHSRLCGADLNSSNSSNNSSSSSRVNKLPIIPLPVFNGNFTEWNSFIELYNDRVHFNSDISNIEKFHHLLASLKGEPLSLVKGLPPSAVNYPAVYKQLTDRYNNPRILATTHWHAILNLPSSIPDNSTALYNLINTLNENLAVLNTLGLKTNEWSFIIFDLVFKKLPRNLCCKFENTLADSSAIPSFDDLKSLLLNHCKGLESVEVAAGKKVIQKTQVVNSNFKKFSEHSFVVNPVENNGCCLCNEKHFISQCPQFLKLNASKRFELIKDRHLCLNCLRTSHNVRNCDSKFVCKTCRRKHHTLLHFENTSVTPNQSCIEPNTSSATVGESSNVSLSATWNSSVLLSTVVVRIKDFSNSLQPVRCLLDTGSMISFITQKCVTRLGLTKNNIHCTVTGINTDSPVTSQGVTQCHIRPHFNDQPLLCIEPIILPQLVKNMPVNNLDCSQWNHLKNLQLADPQFNNPGPVDMILGADVFSEIIQTGKISGLNGQPTAINTSFGWILMGGISSPSPTVSLITSIEPFDLRKFWEIEEIPETEHISVEDVACEKIFVESTSRTADGRFVVALPFKENVVDLGESKSVALKRFQSLERKFAIDPELKKLYSEVIKDYLNCNHLVKVTPNLDGPNYFLPHHAVWKPESTSTKLRIVFDGSCKSSNNKSLNDNLLVGPKLQADIASLLLNFRLPRFIITGDIKQMFRQIIVQESHQNFQRILWRFNDDDPIEEYNLTRVTFGLSSSPYLAMRTIAQLVQEEGNKFPLAARALSSALYVDDCLGGAETIEEAQELQSQLVQLLGKGKFEMRKWASNCPQIVSNISPEDCQIIKFDSDDSVLKILGLQWLPSSDNFSFHSSKGSANYTKRSILSDIARMWDPLGFLSPMSFFAKHLIQLLWSIGVDWDEPPPLEVIAKWSQFKSELCYLDSFKIPRYLNIDSCQLELHGFCDSSEKGYAGCVYLRAFSEKGQISTYLLCGKSKVASLKKMSIPRLELCGAVLLSKLIKFVVKTYKFQINWNKIYAWSDSTVALSWIKSAPCRWKTFVANRVSLIHESVAPDCWNHLVSADNPADIASRGALPKETIEHHLWWNGPVWLSLSREKWPISRFDISPDFAIEAAKPAIFSLVVPAPDGIWDDLFQRFSSFRKILRTVSYVLRFINRCRKKSTHDGEPDERELHFATNILAKFVQSSSFAEEISLIKNNKLVSKSLRKLAPFLDEMGLIRVGGRLRHSQLAFEEKFPILLPKEHPFTDLVIRSFHVKFLHPGPQTLHYLIGQQFWILGAKRAIFRCLSKCFKCFRANPKPLSPRMGDLPSYRVSQIKAFSQCGVDMGGPFKVTMGRYRGTKSLKSYICVFVCFATKAVHIELVSSLSTEAFVAAFRRFVARRGRVSDIHSDCGTNFVGAANFFNLLKNACDALAIKWHFNPPSAPHMGGLWEAAIKSVKTHLVRVTGDQILTFEEMTTLLSQIEALLNSRPLTALSSDPNDLSALTPNHFLNLEPVSSPPDENVVDCVTNRLSRWQLIQNFQQNIWRRWHKEYLQTLQQRQKWHYSREILKLGSLVVVKQDNIPPTKWILGRVVELHKGVDGVARVATVRTLQGDIKRPLVKLCLLPVNAD